MFIVIEPSAACKRSCEKVTFSQVSVCHSVRRGSVWGGPMRLLHMMHWDMGKPSPQISYKGSTPPPDTRHLIYPPPRYQTWDLHPLPPPPPSVYQLVTNETNTVGKRAVLILLECCLELVVSGTQCITRSFDRFGRCSGSGITWGPHIRCRCDSRTHR